MEIISENGKDYLKTFIAKIDNTSIDCTPFFVEVQDCLEELLKRYNKKHGAKFNSFSYLDKNFYGGNLQTVLNRFSGNYFSASFMKSYITNPALCFYSMLCEEEVTSAASIGITFHKVMEKFYKSKERTKEALQSIAEQEIKPGQEKVFEYIEGYLNTPDYLGGELPHKYLECECERSGKTKIYIPKFNATLPTCAYVIDRIDYRDDGIYLVDYKTGNVTNKNLTFEGNLTQMILYKWVVEQFTSKPVEKVYLCAPQNESYMECDCSEENQKYVIDEVNNFFETFKEHNSTRIYPYTDEGYFTNTQAKEFKQIMNDYSLRYAKIPVKVYIGETEDAV